MRPRSDRSPDPPSTAHTSSSLSTGTSPGFRSWQAGTRSAETTAREAIARTLYRRSEQQTARRPWQTVDPSSFDRIVDRVRQGEVEGRPPLGLFSAQMAPPCASMIDREIASPIPIPVGLVV
jgi:hypothetical protein